jgi:hypothetical protein
MARGADKSILVQMYQSGMSIPEVAANTGMRRSTVRRHLRNAGVLRSRADGVRNAGDRGRLGCGMRGKNRVFTESHCNAIAGARRRHADLHAVGISKKPSGYIEHTRGNHKGRSQHRVIMELHIGRRLRSDEHVHHKDGNRSNNDISNLELMTASQHMSHHAQENHHQRRRNQDGTWR